MKRFYQTEWHGIRFQEFTILSETKLADASFYNAFYRELFRRYKGYDELDASWRREKQALVEWIGGQLRPSMRVLSVGCGLGYVEACLHHRYGDQVEVHVSDYASDALQWLRQILPENRIHPVESVVDGQRYDLLYLSAVDYALTTEEMITLLETYRALLLPSGVCVVISASYVEEDVPLWGRIKTCGRMGVKRLLRSVNSPRCGRGQFWGWLRTRSEYRKLMRTVYAHIEDGFIETVNQRTYFIRAK